MAPTFRMTTDASPKFVHLLSVDAFGDQVGVHLSQLSPSTVVLFKQVHEFRHAASRSWFAIVAASHPVPDICDRLDELFFQLEIPWIPVIHEQGGISVGPLIKPGAGACFGCYCKRLAQHAIDADVIDVVSNFYRRQPGAGPPGFFPPAASFAASIIAEIVDLLARGDLSRVALFCRFNFLNFETTAGKVLGIHGCDRCGRKRNERLRTMEQLPNWAAQRKGIAS